MDIFALSEKLMRMQDKDWDRHSAPWSVYSRIAVLPLLVLAIWSRVWLGWWVLLPLAVLIVWVWINPRAFPAPDTKTAWASRGVLGERFLLDRHRNPIPAHHLRWAIGLSALSGCGLVPLVWGLVGFDAGWTMAGLAVTMGGKLWFLDRMVWLCDDMQRQTGQATPGPPEA